MPPAGTGYEIACTYPARKGHKWVVWEKDGTYYCTSYLYGPDFVDAVDEFVTDNLADAKAFVARFQVFLDLANGD